MAGAGCKVTQRRCKSAGVSLRRLTCHALLIRIEQRGLVDVEKVPSEKGPPRKVYSLNVQGQEYLEEFWRTWSFLTGRLEQLHEGGK